MIEFKLNGKAVQSNSEGDTPLLWVVRDELNYKGTKFGCGIAQCGACTVQLDGTPVRSCSVPVSAIAGKEITTIEGLSSPVRLLSIWAIGTGRSLVTQQYIA